MKLGRSGPKTQETRTINARSFASSRAALPFPLRFSVNADRPRLIFFGVRFALFAVENIIGADVNESRFLRATDCGEHTRRFRVERERFLLVRLAAIDIRLRRCVDQRVKIQVRQRRAQLFRRAEIELGVIEPHHFEIARVLTNERRAQPAAGAHNDNSPARFHPTDSKSNAATSRNPANAPLRADATGGRAVGR